MEAARNEFFLLGYSRKIVIYRGELTYGRGGVLGEGIGIFPGGGDEQTFGSSLK